MVTILSQIQVNMVKCLRLRFAALRRQIVEAISRQPIESESVPERARDYCSQLLGGG